MKYLSNVMSYLRKHNANEGQTALQAHTNRKFEGKITNMRNSKPPLKTFDALLRLCGFIQAPLPLSLFLEFYILRLPTTEAGVVEASAAAPAAAAMEALTMTAYFSGVLSWK